MRDACRGAKLVSLQARRGVHPKGSAFAGLIAKKRLPTHKKYIHQLNRIAQSHAYGQSAAPGSIQNWNPAAPAGNLYRTGYSYDANGNIKTLQRYNATTQIDNLSYGYISGKNQLSGVSETVAAATVGYDIDHQGAGNYTYDYIGNLLSDASEEVQEIKWNVYGKVTQVIRSSGSSKPQLAFSYDAAGRRISKSATLSGVTSYTFYTLDAQGNILGTYSKSSANNDVYLDENMLYGSSRLGLQKRVKKLSFVAEASNTPVAVIRGQKRYELSNHLGNVHLVVSDRKQMVCSGNAYSHYEAEIINTYDYYPFGMLMEERKGERSECTASTSAVTKTPYNYTFTWLTHDFIMYGTNVTVNSSGSALIADRNASSVATNWGAQKSGHSLVKGVTYTLSYQLQGAAPSGYTSTIGRTVQVRLKWGATIVASGTLTLTGSMQSGSFNYTADYTGNYTIEIVYTGAGLTKGQFLADNVKITYNSEQTTVNCLSRGERYRYGFNGKEKTDEVYGMEGTFYDYGFRVYDSRIARFLSVDPLTASYPWYTPYQFAGNKPIWAIDLDGLEEAYSTSGAPGQGVIVPASDQFNTLHYTPSAYFGSGNNEFIDFEGKDLQDDVISLIPGLGIPYDIYGTVRDARKGDYISAGISLIGVTPVGDVIKGGRILVKSSDEIAEATGVVSKQVNKADEIKPWQKSEAYDLAKNGGESQKVFKDGVAQKTGKRIKGSIVVDTWHQADLSAVEIKNYAVTLSKGQTSPLINNIVGQFKKRMQHLPEGSGVHFKVDITDYAPTEEVQKSIIKSVVNKIDPEHINRIKIDYFTRK